MTYGGSINPVELCHRSTQSLANQFQAWLQSESFQRVNVRLREELNRQDRIRMVIRTLDPALPQLPWHTWDFVERYPYADIAFSPLVSESSHRLPPGQPCHKVKILAIFGHSQDIDTDADRQLLEQLPEVELTVLTEPQRHQINTELWEQSWDILFFAGHSESLTLTDQASNQGKVYLNEGVSLALEDVRYGLKKAIANGLQLAIFNSCDGLGLAHSLSDLALPQLVVMRELVPDQVAQSFLYYFLQAFSQGQPFHLPMRE
ncbi:CHAT domain-containing protein, partial [Okeania sp. SIO2G5]|uniref:CHAT domain-containing protein n=1 Tax=Okeania sp. SIO2G5 TaxID=2607796 RepID=UPI0013C1CE6E